MKTSPHYHFTKAFLLMMSIVAGGVLPAEKAPFKSVFFNDFTNFSLLSPWREDLSASMVLTPAVLRGGVDDAANGGADAFFLEAGLGWVPWWNGNNLPLEEQYKWFRTWSGNLNADFLHMRHAWQGGESMQLMLNHARARGMAAFLSLRLNDGNHKGISDDLPQGPTSPPAPGRRASVDHVCQFYIENQQFLLQRDGQQAPGWSSSTRFLFDWTHPEVRAWRMGMVRELCENYDMDGLNLDFMRNPHFFWPDPSVSDAERVAIMVDFIQQVRRCLDESRPGSARRWLCVRIPAYLSSYGPMGIDPAAFKAAGVDMFILSTSYDFEQQTEAEAIKRLLPDVAVYHEITHSPQTISSTYGNLFRRGTDAQIQTTASLAYSWGLDGMAFFNFQYYRQGAVSPDPAAMPFSEPPLRVLGKVRDPDWLARQPQEYFLAATRAQPEYRDEKYFPFGNSTGKPLYFRTGNEKTVAMKLKRPVNGWADSGMLRLETMYMSPNCSAAGAAWDITWGGPMASTDEFTAVINGTPLAACATTDELLPNSLPKVLVMGQERARAWTVPSSLLHEGENTITIRFASSPDGDGQVVPVYLSLAIGTGQAGTFELGSDIARRTVMAGREAWWDVNTDMVDGVFNDTVTFSATGVPEGASVSFSAASATGPKIGATRMTVTTTEATPPGVHGITIHGTCGGMEKTTVVTLVVETATVPPPAPSGLRVTGVGRGEVSLAWDPVPGATGYNIMSSRKPRPATGQYRPGVEYQIIADTADTNITLPLLAGEAVYYYFVTAVNAAGESLPSLQVFGRTLAIAGTPPAIPTGLAPVAVASGAVAVELHATVSGDPAPTIHWQVSMDNGAHWEDIINGRNYEGAQNASLKIMSAGSSMNGYLYRYVAANGAGSVTSESTTRLVVLAQGFQTPAGVAQDREGNIYVTDAALHTVHKMDRQGNITVLAGSAGKSGFVNGTGEAARFNGLTGLKINPKTGVLHIADTGNNAVRSLTASGAADTLTDGLNAPAGIATDNDGNIYVADTENHAIRKITTGGAVTLLAGSGDPALSGTTDATGTDARFNQPKGVAVDATNYIYVADSGNHSIRYIRPSDNYVGTLAGVAGVPGSADGPEETARFRNPGGLAVDGVLLSDSADGSLYVADTGNSSIREITRGIVRTIAGHPGIDDEPAIAGVPGFQDGTGTNAWFRYPEDVALTEDGNLVVADTGNGLLRKVTFDNDDNAVVAAVLPAMAGAEGSDNGGENAGGGEGKDGSGGGAISWQWFAGASILTIIRMRFGKDSQVRQKLIREPISDPGQRRN